MSRLYKRSANNILLYWTIAPSDCGYVIEWGQEGTTCPQHEHVPIDTPSSVPKLIESRTREMIERRGYTLSIPKSVPELPMLAQPWADHNEKVINGKREPLPQIAIQPKLDGLRCIASSKTIISRRAEKIVSIPNIEQLLKFLPPEIKLDGELYIHGVPQQTIQSYVRRNQPHQLHYTIEYHIFDLISDDPFIERFRILSEQVEIIQTRYNEYLNEIMEMPYALRPRHLISQFPLKIVPTTFIPHECCHPLSIRSIQDSFKTYTQQGYEGLIIRNSLAEYELNHRSPNLLKYKETLDGEFEIIDVVEVARQCGLFVCKTPEGKIFECNPAWTTPAKQALLRKREEYVGRWLHVKFEKYSLDKVPLKPIGHLTQDRPNSHH